MKNDRFRSIGPALVLIPIGGLVVLALSFLLYGLVYNLLESIFSLNDLFSPPPASSAMCSRLFWSFCT